MRRHFHVAYIADENYAMPMCVSMVSLLKNKRRETSYTVHTILDRVSDSAKEKIRNLNRDDFIVDIIEVDGTSYDMLPATLREDNYITPAAMYKFSLPDLLPPEIDKVLYLDDDIIVQKDLSNLFLTPTGDAFLAAVPALIIKSVVDVPQDKYFNSGVMLMDVPAMKRNRMGEQLRRYRENEMNYFMDQDAFNAVMYGKTYLLNANIWPTIQTKPY